MINLNLSVDQKEGARSIVTSELQRAIARESSLQEVLPKHYEISQPQGIQFFKPEERVESARWEETDQRMLIERTVESSQQRGTTFEARPTPQDLVEASMDVAGNLVL